MCHFRDKVQVVQRLLTNKSFDGYMKEVDQWWKYMNLLEDLNSTWNNVLAVILEGDDK